MFFPIFTFPLPFVLIQLNAYMSVCLFHFGYNFAIICCLWLKIPCFWFHCIVLIIFPSSFRWRFRYLMHQTYFRGIFILVRKLNLPPMLQVWFIWVIRNYGQRALTGCYQPMSAEPRIFSEAFLLDHSSSFICCVITLKAWDEFTWVIVLKIPDLLDLRRNKIIPIVRQDLMIPCPYGIIFYQISINSTYSWFYMQKQNVL